MIAALGSLDHRWWIDLFSATVAPVTACITAYIAYQQWRTNRDRLRVELYDRRVAVLKAVRQYLSAVNALARVPPGDALADFVKGASEADFLFRKDVVRYLDEIYKKSIGAYSLHNQLEGLAPGEQRSRIVKEESDLILWLVSQFSVVNDRFKRYLKLP